VAEKDYEARIKEIEQMEIDDQIAALTELVRELEDLLKQ
jgi:hypothetical protein